MRGLGTKARWDSQTGVLRITLEPARSGSQRKTLGHSNVRAYFRKKTKRWSTKKYGYGRAWKKAKEWLKEQEEAYCNETKTTGLR